MINLDPKKKYIIEHVGSGLLPVGAGEAYLKSRGYFPQVIYPELRVLSADRPTQNKTYYPEKSLRGHEEEGTGVYSFTWPYPIPIIRDHLMGEGGLLGPGPISDVYGRVMSPAQFVKIKGDGFVKAIPSITHPEAVDGILAGRWLTVSLGSKTESVICSICNAELTENECEHVRGKMYEIEGENREAWWKIGPIKAKEISFVLSPSDTRAGVMNPNVQQESTTLLPVVSRILVGDPKGVFDLSTGVQVSESHSFLSTPLRKAFSNFHFLGSYTNEENEVEKDEKNLEESKEEILESKEEITSENKTETLDEILLTFGELYSLPEEHEDFKKEAVLSTAQRKRLPASAFCGPDRSFPAHDAVHVRNGLARLPQSKFSPAQKSRILACLRRKAKRFGIKVSDEGEILTTHAAKLVDVEHRAAIDLYPLPNSKEALEQVLVQVEAMSHLPADKEQILSRIAAHCREFMAVDEWQKLFGNLSVCETGEPISIFVTSENYGLLYSALHNCFNSPLEPKEKKEESSTPPEDTKVEEGTKSNQEMFHMIMFEIGDKVRIMEPHTEEHTNMEAEVAEVGTGHFYVVEVNGKLHRWYSQDELELVEDEEGDEHEKSKESVSSSIDTKEVEQMPDPTTDPQMQKQISELQNTVQKISEGQKAMEQQLLESLAGSVALYMQTLRKSQARGKSHSELVEMLKSRGTAYLTFTLQDLMSEWEGSGGAVGDPSALPKIPDPTVEQPADSKSDVSESSKKQSNTESSAEPKAPAPAVKTTLPEFKVEELESESGDEELIKILWRGRK